ncbi:glutathione peroxidase [Sphingomonas sp. MMS24-J13]|uniref:glutathione peroxidase n=1 Tax=Sphingomonas sp. MMS24-J13 TaxID=3238686 RepID=UPI00384D4BC6
MTAIQDIPLKTISGADDSLAHHEGKVLLVVNVASKCGLTPQYDGLEALYRTYRGKGFEVLGFPANDFGAQEPGTNEEIASFCRTNFSVDFPMFAKISVKEPDQHPLYAELVKTEPAGPIAWNFEKFLIGRDGAVIGRFGPRTTPDDPALVGAIEEALG